MRRVRNRVANAKPYNYRVIMRKPALFPPIYTEHPRQTLRFTEKKRGLQRGGCFG